MAKIKLESDRNIDSTIDKNVLEKLKNSCIKQ